MTIEIDITRATLPELAIIARETARLLLVNAGISVEPDPDEAREAGIRIDKKEEEANK